MTRRQRAEAARVARLVAARAWQGALVLLAVSVVTFALLAAAGGDALSELAANPMVSERALREMRRVYGLDRPAPERYALWLSDFARGRMGHSFHFHAPVSAIIWPRLARTLMLAALALALAWSVALSLGIQAARRPRSLWDRASEVLILAAASTPRIVLALAALALAVSTSLFPVGGEAEVFSPSRALPAAVVLAVPLVALFLAQTRESLRDALSEDFVRVARAKGLGERAVVLRHAMRAALNPLITIFGYSLGGVLSGSVVVETVLGWPGLGSLSVEAARHRDVPLLMAVVMLTATAVLLGNLVADILLRLNDPRLREEGDRRAAPRPRGDAAAAPTV
ncbi:MAG TPA: ABC transporter permease [Pyrinomonadaceae bacterium]|nr:ABC transporter permease [Pyrinomonadaceae bacterium]